MSDYKKEAERVSRVLEDIAQTALRGVENEQIRGHLMDAAALLAHIQRGAVPEGWQLVPKEPTPEMLAGGWGYWLNVMAPGKQRDTAAKEYTAMLAAAPAPSCTAPAPAEVLMPKPVAYGFGNTAITGHTNRLMMVRIDIPGGDQYAGAFWLPLVLADEARQYGAACRAAGDAAGYARGLKEAGRLISLWLKDPDVQRMLEFARDASRKFTSWPDRLNGEAEDALRGEVKP